MKLDVSFASSLEHLELDSVRRSADVIYALDRDYRLRAYNNAWENFARENDGEGILAQYDLGSNIFHAIPEELTPFYEEAYRNALERRERFDHDYECSSPEVYRLLRESVYPLADGNGWLVSHHIIRVHAHTDSPAPMTDDLINGSGMVTQCSHCRKVCVPGEEEQWVWIPGSLSLPREILSHGLCPRCCDFYYPGSARISLP